MKLLGIVGGIAPESTIDYYRRLITAHRAEVQDGSYPSLFITSIDLTRLLTLAGERRLEEMTEFLLSAVEQLARAGANVGLLASNTPHLVFDELARRSPIPLVSIVEAVAAEVRTRRLSRVSLFGTRFTVEGAFYPDVLNRHGVTVVRPRANEIAEVHDLYMTELVAGVFSARDARETPTDCRTSAG
jgi:aspartate racemase